MILAGYIYIQFFLLIFTMKVFGEYYFHPYIDKKQINKKLGAQKIKEKAKSVYYLLIHRVSSQASFWPWSFHRVLLWEIAIMIIVPTVLPNTCNVPGTRLRVSGIEPF